MSGNLLNLSHQNDNFKCKWPLSLPCPLLDRPLQAKPREMLAVALSRPDRLVKSVETAPAATKNIINMSEKRDTEALKASIKEAKRAVDLAEWEVKNRKLHLNSLQKLLQDAMIAGIGGTRSISMVSKPFVLMCVTINDRTASKVTDVGLK